MCSTCISTAPAANAGGDGNAESQRRATQWQTTIPTNLVMGFSCSFSRFHCDRPVFIFPAILILVSLAANKAASALYRQHGESLANQFAVDRAFEPRVAQQRFLFFTRRDHIAPDQFLEAGLQRKTEFGTARLLQRARISFVDDDHPAADLERARCRTDDGGT